MYWTKWKPIAPGRRWKTFRYLANYGMNQMLGIGYYIKGDIG